MKWSLAIFLGMSSCAAQAADTASIVRSTELKAKPFIDAATLATLSENQQVNVLLRDASWYKVKAQGPDGWVKMMSLRFPTSPSASSSGSSSSSFLGAAIGSNRSTSTTGAKGLSKEDLQTAQPNPALLKTANAYATNKTDAQQFAREGKLVAQRVNYFED
jgi:hypothetical protein